MTVKDIMQAAFIGTDSELKKQLEKSELKQTLMEVIEECKLVKELPKTASANIWKTAPEKQIVYGVVIEPWTNVTPDGDSHGDRMTKEEIEKSAHDYMYDFQEIKEQHDHVIKAQPVESFIAPVDFAAPDGQIIKEGSWIMAVKIEDKDVWEKVKKGEITAFSPGGYGKRRPA